MLFLFGGNDYYSDSKKVTDELYNQLLAKSYNYIQGSFSVDSIETIF